MGRIVHRPTTKWWRTEACCSPMAIGYFGKRAQCTAAMFSMLMNSFGNTLAENKAGVWMRAKRVLVVWGRTTWPRGCSKVVVVDERCGNVKKVLWHSETTWIIHTLTLVDTESIIKQGHWLILHKCEIGVCSHLQICSHLSGRQSYDQWHRRSNKLYLQLPRQEVCYN